jgi:hypothetical protein
MKAATAMARDVITTDQPRQALWLDFCRALDSRNFVRAVGLARELNIDEERIRRIQRDALKQFIAEYQNFDAAARLCAEYHITTEEFVALIEEILKRKELETRTTFATRAGRPEHLSIAEQIRSFARRQVECLKKSERRRANEGWRQRPDSAIKSWLDRLSSFSARYFSAWGGELQQKNGGQKNAQLAPVHGIATNNQ